jgi:signal transduction histidine kinase
MVRYLLDCPSAVLQADIRFLPLAVGHLVRNAIIHGGDSGRVDVVATAQKTDAGECVAIVVRDHGPGLSADVMAQCFELFGQSESALTRSEHGIGLGLPYARRVVEAHGGNLRLMTPREGGLAATVTLPARLPVFQTIGQMRVG